MMAPQVIGSSTFETSDFKVNREKRNFEPDVFPRSLFSAHCELMDWFLKSSNTQQVLAEKILKQLS